MGYPNVCTTCVKQKIQADMFAGELALLAQPFQQGPSPFVMLIGLNPTLMKKQVSCVFDLDDKESPIYHYITRQVLKPAGLTLDDIYATNLVKCTFPFYQEPRFICKQTQGNSVTNKAVREFLSPFFEKCKEHLKREIRKINPNIVIAFGEVTHQLIVKTFDLKDRTVDKTMRKAFGTMHLVEMAGRDVYYLPCIRQRAKRHAGFDSSRDRFIKNLRRAAKT